VPTSVSMTKSPSELVGLRARYLEAQLAGDQRRALALLGEAAAGGHTVDALRREVVQAAQLEIGRLWQENRISIAHEHMATAVSQRALVFLYERATPAPRTGKRIVMACVEGEQHELPARMLADHLELAGYDVAYLGANVPTDSLLAVVRGAPVDVVALSVTMSFNVGGLRGAVLALRAHRPKLPVIIGGHALTWAPGLAAQLGVEHAGHGAGDILGLLERLTRWPDPGRTA
jgi:MerR family transcriptional regulator, light-induced transcriptional regulator